MFQQTTMSDNAEQAKQPVEGHPHHQAALDFAIDNEERSAATIHADISYSIRGASPLPECSSGLARQSADVRIAIVGVTRAATVTPALYDAAAAGIAVSSLAAGGVPSESRMRMASTSISAASTISTRPIQGTGSAGIDPAAGRRAELGQRHQAQGPGAHHVHPDGRQAGHQPDPPGACSVRHSQTVTPSSVRAARSWLLAPNRFQKICQTGTGGIGKPVSGWTPTFGATSRK